MQNSDTYNHTYMHTHRPTVVGMFPNSQDYKMPIKALIII